MGRQRGPQVGVHFGRSGQPRLRALHQALERPAESLRGPGLQSPEPGQSLGPRSRRGQDQPLLCGPVSLGSFSRLVLLRLGKQSF